ncbi:fasciclin domain-containing protein [Robiginitalea sp. SC105]|nr:fasciclin domain-containing protein [Robiginitalea sp. SC105]
MGWSQEPPPEPVVRASLPGLASEQFPTLLAAVEAADLMEVLKAGGFTIFAPSDEAFHKLDPSRVREWLDPENKRDLKALVAYHIVAGELTASRILKALSRGKGTTRFTTVQGEELIATLEGSDIYLTDCSGNRARIVCADNINTRLVFHEIDTVVLPRPL